MGCTASSFEAKKRLEAVKGRRRPLKAVSSTLSKKELLSHREDMKISVSSRPSDGAVPHSLQEIITNTPKGNQEIKIETKGSVGIAIIIANNYGLMKVVTAEDNKPNIVINDEKKESPKSKKEVTFVGVDVDEDDDDDGRRIGFEDGEAFPGSPSFRVYFEDNMECSHNEETVKYGDAFTERVSSGDHIVPPKEVEIRRERKKRCFRKVLPKRGTQADVKRILNMKSCYSN